MRFSINRIVCSTALAFLLAFPLYPVTATQEKSAPQQDPPTIKVDVDLVTLTATVLDRKGQFAPDLQKEDFVIYEEGVPQEIAVFQKQDVPVSVGIVFDTSGSMVDKIDEVRDAVVHLIQTTNPEDDIFVMQFSAEVSLVQDFTGDRQILRSAIGRLRPQGSTALYDAIVRALQHVQRGRHKKKALLVITDGNDTSSDINLEQAVDIALKSEVLIYCLGVGHGERGIFGHVEGAFKDTVDVDVLRTFSNLTGGKTHLVEGAHYKRGVDQIDLACQQVSEELRRQYTLGYYPTNRSKDGSYRRIRVEAKKGNFKVRTRDGYFAARTSASPS